MLFVVVNIMNEFDSHELQLIIFLCMERKNATSIEDAEEEGVADLYRHACAMLRGYSDE